MKTYILAITAAVAIILSVASNNLSKEFNYTAENHSPCTCELQIPVIEDETYINDIPFDTKVIFDSVMFQLQDEAYVDDIPFDTEKIVEKL